MDVNFVYGCDLLLESLIAQVAAYGSKVFRFFNGSCYRLFDLLSTSNDFIFGAEHLKDN